MKLPVSACIRLLSLCCLTVWSLFLRADPVVVSVVPLQEAPVLDGRIEDWVVDVQRIVLHKSHSEVSVELTELELWAGYHGDAIYFAIRWADSSPDSQHKPYIWSDESQRYVVSKQREDRLAIQFQMEGEYDVNWLSGKSFKADMWHWKSARSAPIGLAHDKMTIVSREKVTRSFKAEAANGKPIYIRRPSDAGDKLYINKRYGLRENKQMPKYLLSTSVSGSVADVKAAQRWNDGRWTVELSRKLNTNHDDDVVFDPGKDVPGGIAVFNRSGDANHVISDNLLFKVQR